MWNSKDNAIRLSPRLFPLVIRSLSWITFLLCRHPRKWLCECQLHRWLQEAKRLHCNTGISPWNIRGLLENDMGATECHSCHDDKTRRTIQGKNKYLPLPSEKSSLRYSQCCIFYSVQNLTLSFDLLTDVIVNGHQQLWSNHFSTLLSLSKVKFFHVTMCVIPKTNKKLLLKGVDNLVRENSY